MEINMEENTVETRQELDKPLFEDVEMGEDPEIVFSDEPYDESDDEDPEDDSENESDDETEEEGSDDESNEGEESKENEENRKTEDEPKEQTTVQTQNTEPVRNDGNGNDQLTQRQKLVQEIADQLEAADIPNTVEYRKSAIAEAKKAVCKELNIEEDDFNNFDEEHQFLFSEKLEEIRAQKKQKFDAVVDRVQKKQAEENRVASIANLINSQCDTPEKKNNLYKIIRGASTGYTEDMKQELLQGKTDKLQKLINVATGKKKLASPKKHSNSSKNTKTGRDRGYASDLVFG